jgi:hypothetical protein
MPGRPVGILENFLLRLGPSRVTAAWVLDGPPDLGVVLGQVRAMVRSSPRLSRRIVCRGPWHVWRDASQARWEDHVRAWTDPSLTGPEAVVRLIAAVRRLPLPEQGPRWLALAVNPESAVPVPVPASAPGPAPLSAFVLHYDHAIGDGRRMARFVAAAAGGRVGRLSPVLVQPAAAGAALVDERVREVPLAACAVPREALRGGPGGVTGQLIAAGSRLLADSGFYPGAARRTGRAVVTRATRRDTDRSRLGNFLRAVEHRTDAGARGARAPRPRTSDGRLVLASALPARLLRPLVRSWYRSVDQLVTLTPAGRGGVRLGGRAVTAIYAVPPHLARPPLTQCAVSYGRSLHVLLAPGEGFQGDPADLARSYESHLLRGCGPAPV